MTLVSIPANPVPEGAITGTVKTPDGAELRFARFPPPPGRKGTVCLFQGRAEFIEKYFEVVRDLQARGFAVATLDWRGQGLSDRVLADRRKGHVKDFAEYDWDLDAFMKQVVLPDCPPPFFALAHSMGGAILMRALAHGRRWFDRAVMSAPMLEVRIPGSPRAARLTVQVLTEHLEVLSIGVPLDQQDGVRPIEDEVLPRLEFLGLESQGHHKWLHPILAGRVQALGFTQLLIVGLATEQDV